MVVEPGRDVDLVDGRARTTRLPGDVRGHDIDPDQSRTQPLVDAGGQRVIVGMNSIGYDLLVPRAVLIGNVLDSNDGAP